MSRLRILLLLAAVSVFAACPMYAATYAVGSCKPSLPSFSSISAAVSSVPAGSTIEVCPGTYAEQVVIATPLTLEGISSGGSAQVVITAAGGGLSTTTGLIFSPISAQVEVTTGPVNITNITVDGTGGSNGCSTYLVGIYYDSGSSGTVDEATVRNQNNSGCGVGILAENGSTTKELVLIENSSIHDFDYLGIFADSDQLPGTLTVTIKENYIDGGLYGVFPYSGTLGSVTDNFVSGAAEYGIASLGPVAITGNTVTSSSTGIAGQAKGTSVTGNKISNNAIGISLFEFSGMTVKSNTIVKSTFGIEFTCVTGNTVSGNTINDAATGLDEVPSGSIPSDTFLNVATISNICAGAQPGAKSLPSPFDHHPN
jgi:parallel beta-helix repeat protein